MNPFCFETKVIKQACGLKSAEDLSKSNQVWNLGLDMVESNTGKIIAKRIISKSELGPSVFYFTKEYVLYSKLRPYLNKVVLPDEDGYATTELVPLKPSADLNRVYLANLLRNDSFVTWINSKSGGSKMPRAQMDEFRNFKLMIPPIELQNKFASIVCLIDKSKFSCSGCFCDTFYQNRGGICA